jgi:hypothetical protein
MAPKANRKSADVIQTSLHQMKVEKIEQGWQFHSDYKVEGRLPLVEGRLFRVHGIRGWFKFNEARTTPCGVVEIDCFGPYNKDGSPSKRPAMFRCFTDDRVRSVAREVIPPRHRKEQT